MRHWWVVLLLAGCARNASPQEPVLANTRTKPCDRVCVFPEIAMTDLADITHTRESLGGHVVVVHFWATWAKPSHTDLRVLHGMWDRYRQRDVVFISVVTSEDSDDELRTFLVDNPVLYPLVRATPAILAAFNYPTMIPVTFVFGRDGSRDAYHVGTLREDELASLLDLLTR